MAITAQQQIQIIQSVVGVFDASPGGYMASLASIIDNGTTIATLYNLMANAPAFQALDSAYSPAATNAQFASKFVNTIVGVQATQTNINAAVSLFTSLLDSGQLRGAVMKQAVDFLLTVPSSDSNWGNAGLQFNNKVTVATDYTITQSGNSTSVTALQSTIAGVDNTQASVQNKIASNSGTPNTFLSLTTAIDSFTGSAGNDNLVGTVLTDNVGNSTYQAGDTINLAGGTGDVLSLTVQKSDGTATGNFTLPAATVAGTEFLNVRALSTTAADIVSVAAGSFSGLTGGVTADRSISAVTVTGLSTGAAMGMNGNASVVNGAVTFSYTTASAPIILNISNGTTGGNSVVVNNSAATTTATVYSTGAANVIQSLDLSTGATITNLTVNAVTNLTITAGLAADFAAGATVTVAGAATNVNLGALTSANIATVNGSGLTAGGITATLTSGVGTFSGGAGQDIITSAAVTGAAGSINAGAGTTDRLVVGAAGDVDTAPETARYSGFEQLQSNGQALDLGLFAGITALRLQGTLAASNVSGTLAGAITIVGNSTPTINVVGASNPGQIDTVLFNVTTTNATATVTQPVLTGVEILNITANTGTGNTTFATFDHGALMNINVTGGSGFSLTTTATAAVINTSFDATAATGVVTINAAASTTNGVSIKGGTNADVLTGSAQTDTIVGNAGGDTLKGGGVADIVTGGDGADIFDVVTIADSLNTAMDLFQDFTAGTDKLKLANAVTSLAGSAGVDVTSALAIASTGTTAGTLATDIATAVTASNNAAAGSFTQAGDVLIVTLTGASVAGTAIKYVVINDGTAAYAAADDSVVALVGTSTAPVALADFTT